MDRKKLIGRLFLHTPLKSKTRKTFLQLSYLEGYFGELSYAQIEIELVYTDLV
jgi:hypothetical protein